MVELVGEDFRLTIVERLRSEYVTLAARWLDRLTVLLPVPAAEVFPTDTLLDHIPELILHIADFLHEPHQHAIAAHTGVLVKARELGTLRYAQQASLHQIMREYRLLESVLLSFLGDETRTLPRSVAPGEAIALAAHLHVAVSVLQEATVDSFVTHYAHTVADQTERLESFNRMVSHELRQPLGALQFAVKLLQQHGGDTGEAQRLVTLMDRNISSVVELTGTLARLAGMHGRRDTVHRQRVSIVAVAREAVRQLRDMAQDRGVVIHVDDALPDAEVDVGALELALVNLISNAVKYSDPAKLERRVWIHGGPASDHTAALLVRDNGLGIPAAQMATIFQPSSRAHAHLDTLLGIGGLGLGLAICRDCAHALGGDISVTSIEGEGTTFTLQFPLAPRAAAPEAPLPGE